MFSTPNLDTIQGRMLDGLLRSTNRRARMLLTVEITGQRHYQQTFRAKAWNSREDARMVSLDLNDGDWAQGRPNTKVLHVNTSAGTAMPARGMGDELLVYAARAAMQWAFTGEAPQPGNGTVQVTVSQHCGACGTELTHPVSKELGIGPECAKRLGLEHHYRGTTLTSARKRGVAKAREVQQGAAAEAAPATLLGAPASMDIACRPCAGAGCSTCQGKGVQTVDLTGVAPEAIPALAELARASRQLAGRMQQAIRNEDEYVQLHDQLDTVLGTASGMLAEARQLAAAS